jgi:hypothetical protein
MVFTIAGDVVSVEQRSTTFSYLGAAGVGGELIASPLVYFLMEADVWLTTYIGLGCLVLGTGLTFILPETLPKEQRQSPPENAESPPWRDTNRPELAKLGQAISWVIWKDRRVAFAAFHLLVDDAWPLRARDPVAVRDKSIRLVMVSGKKHLFL